MVDCGCPGMKGHPGCYCGARPYLERFVDEVGFPCLALDCSKSLIANCAGPLWLTCDKAIGRDAYANKAPHGGPQEPIVVTCFRTCLHLERFKDAFGAYATKAQAEMPGLRALFAFEDKDAESDNAVFIFAWCDDAEVLDAVATNAFVACGGALLPGGTAAVFGNRSPAVVAALAATGMTYEFGSLPRGFLKSAPHEGFTDYPGPPMIWVSKRFVQPGKNPASAAAFSKACALQYYTAPAMLGSFEFTSEDDPDQLWSLRFFQDYEMGHVAHFPKAISWLPPRVLFTVVPNLRGGIGAEFPVAISISTKTDIDKAIKYNPGNKAYTQYFWEDVIGPMPDMSKKNAVAGKTMER